MNISPNFSLLSHFMIVFINIKSAALRTSESKAMLL